MELNGINVIRQKLPKMQTSGLITPEAVAEVEKDLDLLDRYLTALHYLKGVWWHEVARKPEQFPLNAEVQQKLFDAIKSSSAEVSVSEVIEKTVKEIYLFSGC